MAIARSIRVEIEKSSWIRKMFERGRSLRKIHGDENVFDFSLGSPIMEPPEVFMNALRDLVKKPVPGMHRYMNNAGFPGTRDAVASYLTRGQGHAFAREDIVMTVGAAGAINVALASILDPGDEVVILAPFFVEYIFYAKNHRAAIRVVETADDFSIDLEAFERALNERTKAVIINTPNNPTGRVYTADELSALGQLLSRAEHAYSKKIFMLFDTPYAQITYDGLKNPPLFDHHPSTLIAHSFSKELGLAGQRIGFLGISPNAPDRDDLRAAATINNRTLGFVNAPALMQLALERSIDALVDIDYYLKMRDQFCAGLDEAGFSFFKPQGAFYIFPRTPIEDDVAFAKQLQEENVLVVPGSGFGRKGHIRIAFCVTPDIIERAIPHMAKVFASAKNK